MRTEQDFAIKAIKNILVDEHIAVRCRQEIFEIFNLQPRQQTQDNRVAKYLKQFSRGTVIYSVNEEPRQGFCGVTGKYMQKVVPAAVCIITTI